MRCYRQRVPKHPKSLSAVERRDAWVVKQVVRTSIDESMIRKPVDNFWDKNRRDPALAPIFAAQVRDWSSHLNTCTTTWPCASVSTW